MKLWCILASVIAVIAVGGWITEHRAAVRARQEIPLPDLKTKTPVAPVETAVPVSARTLQADRAESATADTEAPRKKLAAANPMMERAKEMMKQPAMRALVRQQMASQIAMDFEELFTELDLSESERDQLNELLLDRQMAGHEEAMPVDGKPPLTPEERQAAASQRNQALREFLGSAEDFARVQFYEKTQPARTQFRMFGGREAFKNANTDLSREQENQLILLMTTSSAESMPQGSGDMPLKDSLLQSMDQAAERVRLQATSFLSPSQIDALENWQSQMRSVTEVSLEMNKTLLVPDTEP